MSNQPPPLPARSPCGSCPYRRDAPVGLWHPEEAAILSEYDAETWEQPGKLFLCHQENGRICSGWASCHPMEHNLGARMALMTGHLTSDQYDELLSYRTDADLFESGRQAADHVQAADPSPETIELRRKLDAKLQHRLAETEH
ncbi:hypothetical protein C8K30_1011018 [Promicromonospora sp. AC04]|uniref:DUF6283 family protein n=1 Tax=Promicromonospora sp. AC04 TaxID=2135723 RepID=UPI000D4E657B|nr:DUF6283 family protein [Promicromonospora sp. AC04]PUB32492.1 hypothetical protein C8K30_1011018 [Promicromonospora sp. AC04]